MTTSTAVKRYRMLTAVLRVVDKIPAQERSAKWI